MTTKTTLAVLLGLLPLSSAPTLCASTLALTDVAGQGTQPWQGNLGIDFTVNSTITVTQLGVFTADGSGNIAVTDGAAPIQVGIFSFTLDDQSNYVSQLVSPSASFQGHYTPVGAGFDVLQPITPTVLNPGDYSVVALFNAVDLNGNLVTGSTLPALGDTGGGLLSFPGLGRYAGGFTLDFPLAGASGSGTNLFNAGTFAFVPGSVPEPVSLVLLGLGSVCLLATRQRATR